MKTGEDKRERRKIRIARDNVNVCVVATKFSRCS